MEARLESVESGGDVTALMRDIGARAKEAARMLALAEPVKKTAALRAAAKAVREDAGAILKANADDLADARKKGETSAFLDRQIGRAHV